ncbi:MAG: histidine kinase [Acidobacteria bacterium]|nr:histidine kinase [Acidobacteriota bacterium]MBI3424038.1 histidine kinase [Acidobacteriota bacterium]
MKLSNNNQSLGNASSSSRFGRASWRIWVWLLLGWFVLGALSSSGAFIQLPRTRGPLPAGTANLPAWLFLSQWSAWALWVALVPIVLGLRRRFPLERTALRWAVPVHVFAVAGLCAMQVVLGFVIAQLILQMNSGLPLRMLVLRMAASWLSTMPSSALFYGLVLGLASALDYYRQFRERELRASQLETQLAQAQLQMLKMQLHPHFLFNTLNGITGLVRDNDNAAAVQMLVGLSDLLRQTLDNAGKQEVRLREELEWLELYLKLQQMRFSDRLQVRVEAAPETLEALVPNLITQPLVENAIRHGLAPRAAPGSVSLTAQRTNGRLVLRVCDDGVGLPEQWRLATAQGLGLANTAARLRQMYGTDFEFDIHNRTQGGVEARVSIPWRAAAECAAQTS